MPSIAKPRLEEHLPYYAKYIKMVGDDAFAALTQQVATTAKRLSGLNETQAMHRYAPSKWSVKEVVLHMADVERVFAYRALRFARADETELPGFDEEAWAPQSGADARSLSELLFEFAAVRAATLALFAGLDAAALVRQGTANRGVMSVRAAAHVIAGHELHHMAILRERYGVG